MSRNKQKNMIADKTNLQADFMHLDTK